MKFIILTLSFIAACSADVSHLNNMYLPPVHAGSFGSASAHHEEYVQQADEVPAAIGADTYTPAHLLEQQETVIAPVHEQITNTIEEAVAPISIGADTYTPEYLAQKESVVSESVVRPDYDASSHTPAHLIESEVRPGYDATSHTPAHLIESEVRPGYDASSHTPAHLIESEVRPGYDASSHTPVHHVATHTSVSTSITPAHFVAQQEVKVELPETNPIAEQTVIVASQPEHINAPLPLSVDPVASYVQAQSVQQVKYASTSGIDTQYAPNGGYVY